jgi:hypothetical protein
MRLESRLIVIAISSALNILMIGHIWGIINVHWIFLLLSILFNISVFTTVDIFELLRLTNKKRK